MELDDTSKDKLSKQPFIMRKAVDYLLGVINTIINGDCDESTVLSTMGTLNQNAQGKFSDNDLVNYDEACKLLGMQVTNRQGLNKLCKKHHIKQQKMNNRCIGFRRDEILALRDQIDINLAIREFREKKRREKESEKARKRQALYERIMGHKPHEDR